jgi:Ca2+-binding EF-hand superfamily protein
MKNLLAICALVLWASLAAGAHAGDSDGVETNPDELFKKLDTNGDGILTASEIPKEHLKFFERLLRIGDTNKDGMLSREEFDAAMQKTEKPVTDITKTPGIDAGSGPPRPNLDPKQIFRALDKNKDGKLTRDEVEGRPRIKALFDRLGKDELTLDDLTAALQAGGKKAGKKTQKKGTFPVSTTTSERAGELPAFARLLDTNHDGRLSREELSKAVDLFDRLDRNHDGFLDAKELTEMPAGASSEEPAITPGSASGRFKKGGANLQERNLMQLLKRADADGDGRLSMEEVPAFLKKQFSKIDTNGDGFLDKSELEVWFRHHRRLAGNVPEGSGNPDNSTKPGTTAQSSGL